MNTDYGISRNRMYCKNLLAFLGLFVCGLLNAQNLEEYSQLKGQAEKLFRSGSYSAAAEQYKQAFTTVGGKALALDRYNAACAYALAGDSVSAFYHLERLAEGSDFLKYEFLSADPDLKPLHGDERWQTLLSIVKASNDAAEKDLDKTLMAQLDDIHKEDQKYRTEIEEIEEKYGRDSAEMRAHWQLIRAADARNLVRVREILDTRGWLGNNVVGETGNSALFLVIQHADLETQLKYLPMMRDAVAKGNADAGSLALLEDRTALGQGKRQIYGSQIDRDQATGEFFVFPLIDPENVDQRRAEVGLGPIADYVAIWKMTWDLSRHKQRTLEIEAQNN